MIGLDTNVLLRLRLDDDPVQSRRIDALLARHGTAPAALLVSDVVLAEALRTLQSAYSQDKSAQLAALRGLLGESAFSFEDRDAVAAAVSAFERAGCGFADCLIAAKHALLGCEFTATFDRRMKGLAGVRML